MRSLNPSISRSSSWSRSADGTGLVEPPSVAARCLVFGRAVIASDSAMIWRKGIDEVLAVERVLGRVGRDEDAESVMVKVWRRSVYPSRWAPI